MGPLFYYHCSLEMPAPPHRYSRNESISRHMSRLLRHGPRAGEPPLNLDIEDGGVILVSSLLKRHALSRMHLAQSEVASISHEKYNGRKNDSA